MILVENFWPIYRMIHKFIGGILGFIRRILLESRVHKDAIDVRVFFF